MDEVTRRLILNAGKSAATVSIAFTHYGDPVPKGRARSGRGHHYTPKKTVAAQELLALEFKRALRGHVKKVARLPMREGRLNGPLLLVAIFYLETRRIKDSDNLVKLVMDAGNDSGIWFDDRQVTSVIAVKRYVPGVTPQTQVGITLDVEGAELLAARKAKPA